MNTKPFIIVIVSVNISQNIYMCGSIQPSDGQLQMSNQLKLICQYILFYGDVQPLSVGKL